MGEIHNEGRLNGVGPEIKTFLGPEMATSPSQCHLTYAQCTHQFLTCTVCSVLASVPDAHA
jgi:hypothetical protein